MGKRRDEPDEPTLELPSFFRRRKRRADDAASAPAVESEARAGDATSQSATETSAAAEPAEPEPQPEPEPTRAVAPAAEPALTVPAARSGDPEDTTVLEPSASTAGTERPAPAAPDAPTTAAPDALAEPELTPGPTSQTPQPEAEPAAGGRRAARSRRARAPRSWPALSAGPASLVAGAVVGLVGTGLTWAALQGCEALRGTDSCGGPGLLVLVAILALMVVAGALLLKALQVGEPNATSFLGVGLMTVIVLVTLMESLFSPWMFLAVPVLTALSYLAAQWVSTRFVDTEEASPGVDVR